MHSDAPPGPFTPLLASAAFVAAVLLSLSSGMAGGALASKVIYVAACIGIGAVLIHRSEASFLVFVLWCWMLTPLVRRLIDYHFGFDARNIVLIAPNAVSLLILLPTLRGCRNLDQQRMLLPILCMLCLAYGIGVSLVRGSFLPTVVGMLEWVLPLFYLLWMVASPQEDFEAALGWLAPRAGVVVGGYSLIQFVDPQPWDVYWTIASEMITVGKPEPFVIRIFGPLNSPGPLGFTLMMLLLASLAQRGWSAIIGWMFIFPTLVVSQVRASWIGFAVAAAVLTLAGRAKPAVFVASSVLPIIIGFGALAATPWGEPIIKRVLSLTELSHDTSANERLVLYRRSIDAIAQNPFGFGVGQFGRGAAAAGRTDLVTVDSGFVEILLSLGWFAGLIYILALVGTIAQMAPVCRRSHDFSATVAFAAAIAGVIHLPIANLDSFPFVLTCIMLGFCARSLRAQGEVRHPIHTGGAYSPAYSPYY
jgi:hypothetical protein